MKLKIVEKGCWNCRYGDIPLTEESNKVCPRCLITEKKRWKRRAKRSTGKEVD